MKVSASQAQLALGFGAGDQAGARCQASGPEEHVEICRVVELRSQQAPPLENVRFLKGFNDAAVPLQHREGAQLDFIDSHGVGFHH